MQRWRNFLPGGGVRRRGAAAGYGRYFTPDEVGPRLERRQGGQEVSPHTSLHTRPPHPPKPICSAFLEHHGPGPGLSCGHKQIARVHCHLFDELKPQRVKSQWGAPGSGWHLRLTDRGEGAGGERAFREQVGHKPAPRGRNV